MRKRYFHLICSGMKLNVDGLERVAGFFHAFAGTARLALLQELKAGPRTVGDLVALLPTTQANVSKHLGILYSAGLVSRKKSGTSVIYEVCETTVADLCRIACDKINRSARQRKIYFGD